MPMFYLKLCIDVKLIPGDTIFGVGAMRVQSAVLPRISLGVVAFLVHKAQSAEGLQFSKHERKKVDRLPNTFAVWPDDGSISHLPIP